MFSDGSGTVRRTDLGNLTEAQLRAHIRGAAAEEVTGVSPDPVLERGWVEDELAEELPGLGLWSTRVRARRAAARTACATACGSWPGRITGGHVVHMRQDPVPWAYRVLWRKVGLDPDVDRPPAEAIAVERLQRGHAREPEPAGRRAGRSPRWRPASR